MKFSVYHDRDKYFEFENFNAKRSCFYLIFNKIN